MSFNYSNKFFKRHFSLPSAFVCKYKQSQIFIMEVYKVTSVPDAIYYIPNFISDSEEKSIITSVYASPKPKWTCLSNRRLQNWGGIPHSKGMIPEPMPNWLTKYIARTDNIFPANIKANHVLVNEYLSGQGILPHTDGPLFHPIVCTITCGSHTVLNMYKNEETQPSFSVLLDRCSLFVLTGELYSHYKHGIEEVEKDALNSKIVNLDRTSFSHHADEVVERQTRISLTIRHVPSTARFQLRLGH